MQSMLKTTVLTPKQVKAFEKMAGYKTVGEVLFTTDDEAWKLYQQLLEPKI
jgi:hypothetical protein